MKKHSHQAKENKKRVFNRLGMTYVELLCALSLLSLIVVMFTPMLLSSYETLYNAGERVEDAYNSKEEIEDKLATRLEENIFTFNQFDLETNANAALYKVEVTGKKIVSSLTHGLETVFGVARARVNIISPRNVYDDQDNHNVILQVKGVDYKKVSFGKYSYADDKAFINKSKESGGLIHIEVTVPQKNMTAEGGISEAIAYQSTGLANVKVKEKIVNGEIQYKTPASDGEALSNNKDNGRIYLNISSGTTTPLDFTQSPVKIKVYYVDNRDKVKSTSDYLIIEPPTMVFAGETSSEVDYYTSAGVVEKGGTYTLEVNPRKMRLANSGVLKEGTDNPSSGVNFDGTTGTTINTITWVDSDENSFLRPYYVMAGTYSRVYRMYNYKEDATLKGVFPDSNIPDGYDTTDKSFVLSDGSVATQSFWSGDISDQYYFKTMEHSSGYGAGEYVGVDCTAYRWQNDYNGTKSYTRHHHGSRYDYFDKTLRYSMSFNGFSTGYDYQHLANRRISYVLTEVPDGKSFRLGGRLRDDAFSDYMMPWEPAGAYYQGSGKKVNAFLGIGGQIIAPANESKPDDDDPYEGPVYFQAFESLLGGSENKHFDRHFAYLRLKSYISVNPIDATAAKNADFTERFNKGDFWWPYGYNEASSGTAITNQYANDWDWLSQNTANCVDVTSSVFLPDSGSDGQGQVIYFGTVPAYAFIEQASDIGTNEEPQARNVYNGENIKSSRQTGYVVCGGKGEGVDRTLIYRYFNINDQPIDSVSDYFVDLCNDYFSNINSSLAPENNRKTFYTYGQSDKALYYEDFDLRFTFGYCSRWRMAMGDVTYNGFKEEARSYEKYYTASNKDADYKLDRTKPINTQDENNLYYNVWFPGEYYNLTQVATCDEVTVAVGYALSGSSFMKESAAWGAYGKSGGFYGTALGSIYNDGVLAAYVSEDAGGEVYTEGLSGKGERNVIFKNLLYYKTPTFLDAELHSRKSVRFTAVDLYTVAPYLEMDNSGISLFADITAEKEYYAVYGDSMGNAYYSKVATSKVEGDTEQEGDATETVTLCTGANAIAAKPVTAVKEGTDVVFKDDKNAVVNGMCQIKVNDQPLSTIYSEIKTITVENDIMIITGTQLNSNIPEQIVVGTRDGDDTNDWSFRVIINGGFKDVINKATIIGGYYYICGNEWIAAVSLDTLKDPEINVIENESETDTTRSWKSTDKNKLLWVPTSTNIYAVDGRDTKG